MQCIMPKWEVGVSRWPLPALAFEAHTFSLAFLKESSFSYFFFFLNLAYPLSLSFYHFASRDCFGKMKTVCDDDMYAFSVVSLMLW